MTKSAAIPEKQPEIGIGNPVVFDVLLDLIDRSKMGKTKYGTTLQAHNGRNPLMDALQEALDLAMYLRQAVNETGLIDDIIAWQSKTFGNKPDTSGIVAHLESELKEIEEDPTDPIEWIDVIFLALDGLRRIGFDNKADIEKLLKKKLDINKKRHWPDWRQVEQGLPVEHVERWNVKLRKGA